jgi:hypothetical protein
LAWGLWLSCVGDKAQTMGIRGVVVSRCLLAVSGSLWHRLWHRLWQAAADCGSRRTPYGLLRTYGIMDASRMGPLLRSLASLQMERSPIRHRQPATTQGCGPGSAWHAVIIPIRNFSPSPSHPPSLRPAGIPTGHGGGYAPGCCVCGACKSRPTGLLRRDTLGISNPSRLRRIPPATKNSPLESKPRFRTGTPKDRRCSPHHITHTTSRTYGTYAKYKPYRQSFVLTHFQSSSTRRQTIVKQST